ncbi:SGNH/GDSL hydrolase family protein [Cellulomonas dongxiuzhuiae]|uniref:SGNH/GDSL hydrolase family protein n=1 Tax=Cellulomonas dongxiuzhuiae TaxID=2819979 RepID=A0ABX8GLE0_9CELL|nr:SGNH/GDSL hydrolase family protein [Cellulomonas dongxiuzhuiae]MBO3088735.1 SGNH/GDSL hydrolase family protein [Cellulomonas dongxiuzhuiae]MBO3096293.1 SGNH/GDSL hydrolase family protein [Cellulomonas dongxiuzhuiae]QWC16712.1 SGNH/GDSL hydrolase family protein [Cellulomonas dongxiuzhuiae]
MTSHDGARPTTAGTEALPVDPPRWTRYVACGDSFSEGLWDAPDGRDAPLRGWADQLASHLSRRRTAAGLDPLEYANLAVRGRLMRPILHEQVPAALALEPDLVSVIGGGNDILRPSVDVDRVAADLERVVAGVRSRGVDVLLGTGFDVRGNPLVRTTRARVGIYNAHIWSIARRHGAYVLDPWGMRSLLDWRMWSEDRIHLTTEGHTRVAQGALVALGQAPDRADWDDPLAPLPPVPRLERARADARWLRDHAYPWATRRLQRRSSGDLLTAKRPVPTSVE